MKCSSYPTGDFSTGCCDVMVGRDESGVLMRLFYPSKHDNNHDHRSNWAKWYMGTNYSKGLGIFFLPWLYPGYQLLTDILTRNSYIPTVWEAPPRVGRFPLVIFSHGLAAHRSLYSSVCNDLASHGFIVAALEHRDRSACATFVLHPGGKKKWLIIKPVLSHKREFDIRFNQVKIRAEECRRALTVLERLDRGEVAQNELSSSLPLAAFKGKIDTANAVLSGHSFGGAATILALSRDKRFRAGICLDPWMYPLEAFHRSHQTPSESDLAEMHGLSESVKQPLLFVLMEEFQDQKNLDAMKKYEKTGRNHFWTLHKAIHLNQTDTPILFMKSNLLLKHTVGCSSVIHPATALKLNNNLMVNFICDTCNIENPYRDEYANYIYKNNRWAIEGARGTAKRMAGWHKSLFRKVLLLKY